jgi:hypothetical protein
MFAGFTDRLNFGMGNGGGGTVSVPSSFPTRPIGQLGNYNTYAINFILAANITDGTQQSAINQLCTDLVNTGLMDRMIAVYPFVGGNATSHSYNLKDPRDADAAFRLTFSGGWTHSSTGILPNGTNTFANTYINTATSIPQERHHISYYSRTGGAAGNTITEVGCNNGSTFLQFMLGYRFYSGGSTVFAAWTTTLISTGFWVGNKISFSDRRTYRNGTREGQTTSSVTTTLANFPLFIGARNTSGTAQQFSSKECAFCTIGLDLTDEQVGTLYTIVQNFQTTLGRQV